MGKEKKIDLKLASYDDIFSTQEQREEEKLSKIHDIPISEIVKFPEHPYRVKDDEDMIQLVESIEQRGMITPATVRINEDGKYELVSGHRRMRACELAGMSHMRCEVMEITRDEAIILMVESNLQRSEILPSEKAFAYKMRLEAMKRQVGRPSKNNIVPVGQNYSREELSEQSGESQTQIQRYIRLTELIPELLEYVDIGRMKMRPAVELSYLERGFQYDVLEEIEVSESTPSHAQALKMKKFQQENKLSTEVIMSIMVEEKPNQKAKYTFQAEKLRAYIPKNVPEAETADYVFKALEHYQKYLIRANRNKSER